MFLNEMSYWPGDAGSGEIKLEGLESCSPNKLNCKRDREYSHQLTRW